jgi:hypothetical protein
MFSSNTSQVSGDQVFIEDVFSTWLYTGTGSSLTINNGIDLSTKGGLVWGKDRTNNASNHILIDTNRWSAGNNALLYSNLTNSQQGYTQAITAFSTTGFTLGTGTGVGGNNASGTNYVSWTFRKQPKFFDVVTWTGNNTAGRNINHSLGSTPGFIIIKCTSTGGSADYNWVVYHRSLGATQALFLNTTAAQQTLGNTFANTEPTSTQFTLGAGTYVNETGQSYVAYLFAHNAGGFGLTGTDNVISCGSFTTPASGDTTVTLGWEPQWILFKRSDGVENWRIYDNMRGLSYASNGDARLFPNTSGAESLGDVANLTPTGFVVQGGTDLSYNATYIYVAIRRGPMKTPTTGTSVFSPAAQAGGSSMTTNFPADLFIGQVRGGSGSTSVFDRMRSNSTTRYAQLNISSTAAENTGTNFGVSFQSNTSVTDNWFGSGSNIAYWNFRRAPGFFDVVCYRGTGVNNTAVDHNLSVTPELIIIKRRDTAANWRAFSNFGASNYRAGYLDLDWALSTVTYAGGDGIWAQPTSTTFRVDGGGGVNGSGGTHVAYLFASCPGVSKVGSYTGNGSSQTIDCGFTGGARFFLVKRTDSTGDWWVYDSARGITAPADPALRLNSTAAEVTSADAVDPTSVGIVVNQEATCNINVSSATYIYLAIA